MEDAELGDEDIGLLANLNCLKWLEIDTDRPIGVPLPSLPKLEVLAFTGAGVGDNNFPMVSRFPNLKCLDVSSSSVTDKGIESLVAANPNLLALVLGWCDGLSPRSVRELGKLKRLKYLYVNHTAIESKAGEYGTVPKLQIKLPRCHIRCGER